MSPRIGGILLTLVVAASSASGQNSEPGDKPCCEELPVEAFVGDIALEWPFRQTALYRPVAPVRYSRVDGYVIGARMHPLEWDLFERVAPMGQVAYAFASKRWQYELGAEVRASGSYGRAGPDLKLGGSYRRLTTTDDLWKTGWLENSLIATTVNYDLFDYYETRGWTAYASVKIRPVLQVTAGYRDEDHNSLPVTASWSILPGKHFRPNSPIDEGRVRSALVAIEGGRIRNFRVRPEGLVFRVEGEIGRSDDFPDYTRIIADLRYYVQTEKVGGLSVRLRGATTHADAPYQKLFSIGGIGSMRGYPQNAFVASRVLVGNLEYAIPAGGVSSDWLEGLAFIGFVDAGWTNSPFQNKLVLDDVMPSAGIALGLLNREVRVDLAFPLSDAAGTRNPSLWLRLVPAF